MLFVALVIQLSVVQWGVPESRQLEGREALERDARESDRMFRAGMSGRAGTRNAAHAKVKRRVEEKKAELRESRAQAQQPEGMVLLNVSLIGLFGDHPEGLGTQPGLQTAECAGGEAGSAVYATLLVPMTFTLYELHSKAIAPALGYRRRYHAHIFTDPTDGAQFGINGEGHPGMNAHFGRGPVDLMHMPQTGYESIDDRTVVLTQLLKRTDDYLFYLYDLGDLYNHSVRVIDIIPGPVTAVSVQDAVCPSLQGPAAKYSNSLTCPADDYGDGSRGWCERHERPLTNGIVVAPYLVYANRAALLAEMQARVNDAATRPVSNMDDGHMTVRGRSDGGHHAGAFFDISRDGWEQWELIAAYGNPAGDLFVEKCYEGDVEYVTAALEAPEPAPGWRLANVRSLRTNTCLHAASWEGHLTLVRLLVENGALVDSLSKDGGSALSFAASQGHTACVQYLLAVNASVDIQGVQDTAGQTALMGSAQAVPAHVESLRLLVDAGADATLFNKNDFTALMLACMKGNTEAVSILLTAQDMDIDSQGEEYGRSALMGASAQGYARIVRVLLDNRANTNLQDADGYSALHWASEKGSEKTVSHLLGAGASVRTTDNRGQTPYEVAKTSRIRTMLRKATHKEPKPRDEL